MSEYKRLTNNNLEEYDPEYDFCIECKYFGEPNGCNRPNGTCDNYDRFIEMYTRLTELEDQGKQIGYDLGSKETAERDFNAIIKALETKKESIMTHYGVKESVGVDVAIRTVKELAKQFGVETQGDL